MAMMATSAARDPAPEPGHATRARSEHRPRLEISLFGGVVLRLAGVRIEPRNRKAMALLGYLALGDHHSDTRERLVGMLWSETEEAKARATLRQVLKTLRAIFVQCGFDGFTTGRADVALDPAAVTLDVWSSVASVAAGRPDDALLNRTRITETVLAGYEDIDPSYRSWLLVYRENLHRRLTRGLEDHLSANPRDDADVLRLAQALAQLDPTHEVACQRLMRCHAATGDVSSALSAYKRLWDLLGDEYDMEPSEATQALVATIKSGTALPQLATVPGAATDMAPAQRGSPRAPEQAPAPNLGRPAQRKLVLFVGPSDVDGVPADQKYIGIGFRHELIVRLTRFREWALIDGTTVSGVPSSTASVQHKYVVTPRFFKQGSSLTLIVTLQSSDTGLVVWSEKYELSLANFPETQQRVLQRIANVLNVNVSAERLAKLASAPDVLLDTYDRWLRGQGLINLYRPSEHAKASQIFESLANETPNLSLVYSSLVQLENTRHIIFPGTYRTLTQNHKTLAMARTAINLDPLDSRAQLCLAWSYAFNGQFEMAVASFRQACSLNEDDPWTTTSAALGLAYSNELADAASYADRALELTPMTSPLHYCYQGTIRFICGDYAASIRAAEQSGDAIAYFHGWQAAAFAHANRMQEARAAAACFIDAIREVWSGKGPPVDKAIVRWLLHCFPMRSSDARKRLQQGLEMAGLPAPD